MLSFDSIKKHFQRGGFARSAAILMTGTTIAQAISIAAAPILTRIYSPSDFGIYALFMSFSAILGVLATGKYDIAVMLPKSDRDALNVLALSAGITAAVSTVVFIAVAVLNQPIASWLGNDEIATWLYLVPVSVLLTGLYQSLYIWSVRRQRFRAVTNARVSGSATTSSIYLAAGLASPNPGNLIVGSVAGQTVSAAILSWNLRGRYRGAVSNISWRQLRQTANRYCRFPLFTLPSEFANSTAQQLPYLLLGTFFGTTIVGFFSLTERILGLPISLVSSSVLDVFRQRASSEYNESGSCRYIFVKTFKSLMLLTTPFFLVFFFIAPTLFSVVFGPEWRVAGEYAQILTPLFWIRFVASPLSYVFFIAEKQHVNLVGQLMLLICAAISISAGGLLGEPKISIALFSASYFVFYVIYLYASFRYTAPAQQQPGTAAMTERELT